MQIGHRQTQTCAAVGIQFGQHCLVVMFPFTIDRFPLLLREFVDLGGDSVMFAGTHQVLCVVASCNFPVRPKLLERFQVANLRDIGLRLDSEVGMS